MLSSFALVESESSRHGAGVGGLYHGGQRDIDLRDGQRRSGPLDGAAGGGAGAPGVVGGGWGDNNSEPHASPGSDVPGPDPDPADGEEGDDHHDASHLPNPLSSRVGMTFEEFRSGPGRMLHEGMFLT